MGIRDFDGSDMSAERGEGRWRRDRFQASGFTLTEILVALTILAVLIVLAYPAVQNAVSRSHTAKCINNLRQLGVSLLTYQAERVDLIPGRDADFALPENFTWVSALRPYCDLSALRSCPAAPQPGGNDLLNGDGTNKWGSTRSAWSLGPTSWMLPSGDPGYASYGLNLWVRAGFMEAGPENERGAFPRVTSEELSNIPLIMDARWESLWPVDADPTPAAGSLRGIEELPMTGSRWRMIDNLAMKRHGNGVNICFFDGSVRNVDVNDLWSLKWNTLYNPRPRASLH